MKDRTLVATACLTALTLLPLGTAFAQHHEGEHRTFVGRVVGLACYMSHGTMGDSHRDCALECARAGVPLAILDQADGTLYLPLAKEHHQGANEDLIPFAEQEVRVTGAVIEKDGLKAITIESLTAP